MCRAALLLTARSAIDRSPRETIEQSSIHRPDTPTASTPTGRSPGPRAAYPGSIAGSANLVGNGHASWEMWQLSRFVNPL
jgi:hypothetical protein